MLLVVIGGTSSAQDTFTVGTLPALNLNHKLSSKWAINANYQSRQVYRSGEWNGRIYRDNSYVLSDFTFIGARNVGLNNKIAFGYMLRDRTGQLFHRTIQQFIVVRKLSRIRIAHRIATDQTFSPDERTEYRLRYRLAMEVPLNGQSVDIKEFYLKLSNEYLHSWQGSDSEVEGRVVGVLGFELSTRLKFESGVDYRLNPLFDNPRRSVLWGVFNCYIII